MQGSMTNRTPFYRAGFHLPASALVIIVTLALGACTMSDTQKRTGGGAALGAAAGALIGTSRESALIGAAVGAAGGYLVDQHKKREDSESETETLRAENERLRLEADNQRLQQ
jgi:hypothetical protein